MTNSHELDYRREHFRTTLVPLTFGRENLQPALPNTIWDFHRKAWQPITDETKILTYGNANGYEQFFTMPFVDIPMTEDNWDPRHDGRLDRFMRAINYRKIWRYWHAWGPAGGYGDQDQANVQAQFRRGLAYAIYPAVACIETMNGDLEQHRAWFRQFVPAIEELSVAGWEPVPYARASAEVVVERFGSFATGDLHFTLRNYADQPVEPVLTLERPGLGIPASADLLWVQVLPLTPRLDPFATAGQTFGIGAKATQALWVGTRDQAAQRGFRLALATLEKIERLFQTVMDEAARTTWTEAVATARRGLATAGAEALAPAETQALTTRRVKTVNSLSPAVMV